MGVAVIPRFRPTARLLVIDPRTRLLLFRFDNGRDRVSWLTPGGGIHRGETVEAAAVRELAEETGYMVTEADLGPAVATRAGIWRTDRSGRLVFGADSRPTEELVTFAKGADLLLIEATLPRPERDGQRGHLTPREAGEHGRDSGVNRLVLTHISDELDHLWAKKEARAVFDGPVEVATEGAVYSL